jgi:hypothetical protein
MDIAWQAGPSIVNVEYNNLPQRDHLESGITLLRQANYAEARRELGRAIEESPCDEKGHYYLAIALLDGSRPNRRPYSVLARIRHHLRAAATLPEAKVLNLMIEEDYGFKWRHHTQIPPALFDLVELLGCDQVSELLTHVPARGTRTYKVLSMATDDDEPDRS